LRPSIEDYNAGARFGAGVRTGGGLVVAAWVIVGVPSLLLPLFYDHYQLPGYGSAQKSFYKCAAGAAAIKLPSTVVLVFDFVPPDTFSSAVAQSP
jgi:hypothetical protein